jgi:NACHT domain/Trypsin-like peptidase domain
MIEQRTADRVVVVLGGAQGSGYLLTQRMVLTAGHVLGAKAEVVVPGAQHRVSCKSVWVGQDVALLEAAKDVGPAAEPVAFGHVKGSSPLPGCFAVGFPRAQRYEGGRLDSEQFVGTLKPGANLVRGTHVVDNIHTPPLPPEDGGSPWAGMSGAPLFHGRYLVGVVVHDPANWQHGRLEAVPVARLLGDSWFLDTYHRLGGRSSSLIDLTGDPAIAFEHHYRAYVARTYGELSVFGLDFSRSEHGRWPLDTAYLSLELVRQRSNGDTLVPDRSRVEHALRGHRQILLRGIAGSGKTTLVQWLAVNAAQNAFDDQLAHFSGRIPFVLPLRAVIRRDALPTAEEFLSAAGHPLDAPPGWASSVLRERRGLLLIDGVDEVPEADRTRTRQWLLRLLTAYPDNAFVVTTRPNAVDEGWLHGEAFTEFSLLPMSREDVTAFVERWHRAAGWLSKEAAAQAELDSYREQLMDALHRKPDLARLATNPLMCAMVCALHRDRRSFLPESRMELYAAALSMLLVRRDRERSVSAPERLEILEAAQLKLLQEIAWWMIRNDMAEADQDAVVEQIARLLPSMPRVAQPEEAADVFRHLLHRSGLLRKPAPGQVDFLHRTFLDYLGAKAAVEAQDLNLVAAHAHERQWEDVVRMAVGHARDHERATLLRRLVELGDADESRRARLHLLAAASLEHATTLDPEVRELVAARAAALIPPASADDAEQLAEAGEVVLDLLPGPDGLSEEEAAAVVHAARRIGGEHALQVLRAFRAHPSLTVRNALVRAWPTFEATAYATQVLAHLRTDDLTLWVTRHEELSTLALIGPVPKLSLAVEGSLAALAALGLPPMPSVTVLGVMAPGDNPADEAIVQRLFPNVRERVLYVAAPSHPSQKLVFL